MNNIESAMMNAIETRKPYWHRQNTEVRTEGNVSSVYLHGYLIANYDHAKNKWEYSDAAVSKEGETCGTHTTLSRLNAMGANIYRKKGKWYYRSNNLPFVNDFLIGDGGEVHYNRWNGTYSVY